MSCDLSSSEEVLFGPLVATGAFRIGQDAQARQRFLTLHLPSQEMETFQIDPKCVKEAAVKLSDLSAKLDLIDRYERRALSRRKFAVREFDALRRGTPSPKLG